MTQNFHPSYPSEDADREKHAKTVPALAGDWCGRIEAYRDHLRNEPQFNPIKQLAFEISRSLEAGELHQSDLSAVAKELSDRALVRRAKRTRHYLGSLNTADTSETLRALVRGSAQRNGDPVPYDDFASHWETPWDGFVVTAHPTFAMSERLREALLRTGKPIIFSAGLALWEEIGDAAADCKARNIPVAILQCTSKYPSPLEETGLNVIDEIQSSFGIPSGLSDHSGTIFPALAAFAIGAPILEIHVVYDKRMFGPDVKASITLDDLTFLVKAREAFGLIATPVDKDQEISKMGSMRNLFGRSLAMRRDLEKGTVLAEEHLTLKKPGTGIPHSAMEEIVGKSLKTDVPASRLLRDEDIG